MYACSNCYRVAAKYLAVLPLSSLSNWALKPVGALVTMWQSLIPCCSARCSQMSLREVPVEEDEGKDEEGATTSLLSEPGFIFLLDVTDFLGDGECLLPSSVLTRSAFLPLMGDGFCTSEVCSRGSTGFMKGTSKISSKMEVRREGARQS